MRITIFLFCVLICQIMLGQGIKIKDVKETVSGIESFHAPVDSHGNPCGLVKILSVIEDLSFDGSIVGNVDNKNNEYHVFMLKGSKELIIKRPHVLPVKVRFEDYGIDEILSKATYSITLKDVHLNANKNGVTIDVRPKETNVSIDGNLIDKEDGFYHLLLPNGEHVIKMEAKGYRPTLQVIQAGKKTINLSVELESLLATLDINCQTSTAEIWVGEEMKGKGAWVGKVFAGTYKVTAKQKGYIPRTKEISIEEKGTRSIVLPSLERAMGKLIVSTIPSGGLLTIDGQCGFKTETPIDIKTGQHTIVASQPFGYKDEKVEVDIDDGLIDSIRITMTPQNSTYAEAFNGNIDKQIQIMEAISDTPDSVQYEYWKNRIYEEMLKKDDDSFLIYYDKMGCSHDNNLTILLRKANLNRAWSSQEDKRIAYSNISRCYEYLGDYPNAIEWGIKLCKMDPEYISYKQLAQLYEKINDKKNAILIWEKAAGDKWDVDRWESAELADAYYRLGYKAEAARCYRDLLDNWDEGIYKDKKNEWRKKLKEMGL